jgi:hypothetical protein
MIPNKAKRLEDWPNTAARLAELVESDPAADLILNVMHGPYCLPSHTVPAAQLRADGISSF